MNNLHRELAPISDEAWAQIEQEAARTARRYLAGRRVADVQGPGGDTLAAVGTGRLETADSLTEGVQTWQRRAMPLIQLRAPFTLSRAEIDSVARGAQDADWDPVRAAARQIALAEDLAVFSGYPAAGITGIVPGASNSSLPLPTELHDYPAVVAAAIERAALGGRRRPVHGRAVGGRLHRAEPGQQPRVPGHPARAPAAGRRDHLGARDLRRRRAVHARR